MSDNSMGDIPKLDGLFRPIDRLRARQAVSKVERSLAKATAKTARHEGALRAACAGEAEVRAQLVEARERVAQLPDSDPNRPKLTARLEEVEERVGRELRSLCPPIRLGDTKMGDQA